ncbi:hypothetical protein APHAL10511_002533 [Amanita phalloides]|nr:hypothetical protein APHAL10511_002533 [Amanita phalloides]
MGNPSYLLFVPASVVAIPIDWTRVPEESKGVMNQYGYNWTKRKYKPLPATVGRLAKMFHETKFFGYLGPDIMTALMDISKFGLQPTHPAEHYGSAPGPRFYMKAYNEVWFFLFAPGTTKCYSGHLFSAKGDDELKAIAEAFDAKIEENALRGVTPELTAVLGGWTVSTAEDTLKYGRLGEALLDKLFPKPGLGPDRNAGPSKRENLDDQELTESARKKAKKTDPEEDTGRETRQSARLKKQKITVTAKKMDQEELTTSRVTRRMAAEKQKVSGATTQKKNASPVKRRKLLEVAIRIELIFSHLFFLLSM